MVFVVLRYISEWGWGGGGCFGVITYLLSVGVMVTMLSGMV